MRARPPERSAKPQESRPAGKPQAQHGAQHGAQPGAQPAAKHGGKPPPRPPGQYQFQGSAQTRHTPASRAPAPTGGGIWLYGLHTVAAALINPQRRLRRLLLTEEAESALAPRLGDLRGAARSAVQWPVPVERTDRTKLDALVGRDAVHQGAALLADPLSSPSLEQTLMRPGPVLVLDQVSDPRNVGAILRSAAAFGAAAVIVQDRNAPEETGTLAKAASGALETMPLLRAVNLSRTLVALKAAGLWTVGLDAGGSILDGAAFKGRRVALVLGAEGEGLRRLTRETCDEIAGLRMPGDMESLNVSNAAAVALYEMVRV